MVIVSQEEYSSKLRGEVKNARKCSVIMSVDLYWITVKLRSSNLYFAVMYIFYNIVSGFGELDYFLFIHALNYLCSL